MWHHVVCATCKHSYLPESTGNINLQNGYASRVQVATSRSQQMRFVRWRPFKKRYPFIYFMKTKDFLNDLLDMPLLRYVLDLVVLWECCLLPIITGQHWRLYLTTCGEYCHNHVRMSIHTWTSRSKVTQCLPNFRYWIFHSFVSSRRFRSGLFTSLYHVQTSIC